MLCRKCETTKNVSDFYVSNKTICKECVKSDVRKNREMNLEYYREYDRNRANRPERVELRREVAERWKADPALRQRNILLKRDWIDKNREKRNAHIMIGNALKYGKIKRLPCEKCGNEKSEAHHDDYSKPMDVRWLCKKHHTEHHKLEREHQRLSLRPEVFQDA